MAVAEDEVPLHSQLLENNQHEKKEAGEVNDSPIEEVRLTVPITDDPTEAALTFRTWFLGLLSCCFTAFVDDFFEYRTNKISIGSLTVQIVALPLGKLMAVTLPKTKISFPFTKWSFSLNPGPFSMKEHVLITIFSGCGGGGVFATHIITIVKVFYHRQMYPIVAILLALTTQLLGFGWAGLFRKYLVDSPYMWWPRTLVSVSLFRALHEKEKRSKKGVTRLQFFVIAFICSFAYCIVPGYLFPSISSLSFVCWIWKDSITAQQIGAGLNGFGIGSFGLDWSTISFFGNPMATPLFSIVNTLVGFFLFFYFLVPICYYTNVFQARRFPLVDSAIYDDFGHKYNITRILNDETFDINKDSYDNYSRLNMSILFALVYGLCFAALPASVTHVALFEGKRIWTTFMKAKSSLEDKISDVHARLMEKNYDAIPNWWFYAILILTLSLSVLAVEGFGKELQLPWWGVLLACGIALFFTLPIGIIEATTNNGLGLSVISELIIGYIYPGKPLANVCFKTYGMVSMAQALHFIADLKLGHYMKIPPKSMFIAQLAGTVVVTCSYFATTWWLVSSVENICYPDLLPKGSPWTCPEDNVIYSASAIWGVVGPLRMFTNLGNYPQLNWFFLIGFLAPFPVWLMSLKYPHKKWIKLIHMPLIIAGGMNFPSARAVHYISWGTVGILFNWYVYRRYKGWWTRHAYVLSAALDSGVGFMGIFIFFFLQSWNNTYGPDWWGSLANDHCPLAHCPTQPGIIVEGCPVI